MPPPLLFPEGGFHDQIWGGFTSHPAQEGYPRQFFCPPPLDAALHHLGAPKQIEIHPIATPGK